MKLWDRAPTRRQVAAGIGAALTVLATPQRGRAQPADEYSDGWRILRARDGKARLRGPDAAATDILGYGGGTPGPLLRVRRDDELRVRLINELADPTTIHWHGLRVPNAMDGVPNLTQPPVAPGASSDYRFTARDAGTFWYHSLFNSSEQTDRGLYGPLIVDETTAVAVDHDVVLVLDEWRLASDGVLAANATQSERHLTVNGAPAFNLSVKSNERLRLRLINAANARVMALRIEKHRADVMAIDGQPAEPFMANDGYVVLGPGNRIDLFIDAMLAPGTKMPLLTFADGNLPLVQIAYDDGPPARPAPLPPAEALPANPLPAKMNFTAALKIDIPLDTASNTTTGTNGSAWAPANTAADVPAPTPLFSVTRGRTVMPALINRSDIPHAVHLHGHHFRLLDRLDDGWKPFWLDTVVVPARQTVRIAFVADAPGKWMLHRHALENRESAMAAWFSVG